MNRIVSLLLIPFFVLGQALPHSHAGSGIAEPGGHTERPHVHVSTHHHDHGNAAHSHSDHQSEGGNPVNSDGVTSANEHDSDAVYLVASPDLMTLPTQSTAVRGVVANWQVAVLPLAAKSECQFRSGAPPNRYAALPIFLLTASLRL
jgi:hypothetical protein